MIYILVEYPLKYQYIKYFTYLWCLRLMRLIQPHGGTPIEDTEPAIQGLQLIVLQICVIFGYIVQINGELMICNKGKGHNY